MTYILSIFIIIGAVWASGHFMRVRKEWTSLTDWMLFMGVSSLNFMALVCLLHIGAGIVSLFNSAQ